jgi:hypothetical protein
MQEIQHQLSFWSTLFTGFLLAIQYTVCDIVCVRAMTYSNDYELTHVEATPTPSVSKRAGAGKLFTT